MGKGSPALFPRHRFAAPCGSCDRSHCVSVVEDKTARLRIMETHSTPAKRALFCKARRSGSANEYQLCIIRWQDGATKTEKLFFRPGAVRLCRVGRRLVEQLGTPAAQQSSNAPWIAAHTRTTATAATRASATRAPSRRGEFRRPTGSTAHGQDAFTPPCKRPARRGFGRTTTRRG